VTRVGSRHISSTCKRLRWQRGVRAWQKKVPSRRMVNIHGQQHEGVFNNPLLRVVEQPQRLQTACIRVSAASELAHS
jgi:hypothetical protein